MVLNISGGVVPHLFRTTFLVIDESPGNIWSPLSLHRKPASNGDKINNDGSVISFILETMAFQS